MIRFVKKIIFIDDDPVNNQISTMAISKYISVDNIELIGFDDPQEGLNYLITSYIPEPVKCILFLDINMPKTTGWDVLRELEKYYAVLQDNIAIYILSSSVDPADKAHAYKSRLVQGFLEKPLYKHLHIIFD